MSTRWSIIATACDRMMINVDSPLKIGLVFDDSLDRTDGVQQYIVTLGAWLSTEGHEVHYLVGETIRTDLASVHSLARNWKVHYNGNNLSIPLPASKRRLRAVLSEQSFDVLHVQTPYSPFMAGRLIRLCAPTTAVVGTFHILPYDRLSRWSNYLLALLNRRTARRFTSMIANSQPSKAFADKTYGFRSQVIPNPFPLVDFEVRHVHQPTSSATSPPASIPTIIFLGRLVERKGASYLLQAVATLRELQSYSGPLKVIIGGKGPLLTQLQDYVREHQLTDTVSFAGFVAEADKAAFLATADLAVFPSLSGESFGISLLEAMAAAPGVVLAGDNPGYRSVIEPLNPDQLIQPKDVTEFAINLANWLNNPAKCQAAARSQQTYVKQFDITVVGPQIVKNYHRAASALQMRSDVR